MICFSISAPFPWGTRGRSGYCSQGERLHSGRDPKRTRGRNRESRRREAAGRRNYPEAVPKERSGGMEQSLKYQAEATAEKNHGRIGSAAKKHRLRLRPGVTEGCQGGPPRDRCWLETSPMSVLRS